MLTRRSWRADRGEPKVLMARSGRFCRLLGWSWAGPLSSRTCRRQEQGEREDYPMTHTELTATGEWMFHHWRDGATSERCRARACVLHLS
jgi:hypothetical protein